MLTDWTDRDVLDLRDVIERVEVLELDDAELDDDDTAELAALYALLNDVRGAGGDHEWQGHWYPVTLVSDTYFEDYARELCEDIGDVPRDMPDYLVIDWEATARNIQMDYSSVEIDGETFWYL